jgi:hypothetical protein
LALLAFMALNIGLRVWLPNQGAVRVPWLIPAVEAVLLALLLAGHPGSVAKHARPLRRVAVTLVVVLVAAALWATGLLVYDLLNGLGVTNSPSRLLASGAVVCRKSANCGRTVCVVAFSGGGRIRTSVG